MPILQNAKVRWASVQEPNTKYEPVWEVQAVLTPEQAATLRSQNVPLKEEDGELTYRFKRKVGGKKKDGSAYTNTPPTVVDGNKDPFTDLIGNDSICNIAYNIREWSMMGNSGVKADLTALQVVEHVPYSGGGGADAFDTIGDTVTTEADDYDDDSPF